jgi:hypothetical protein
MPGKRGVPHRRVPIPRIPGKSLAILCDLSGLSGEAEAFRLREQVKTAFACLHGLIKAVEKE